MKNGSSLSVSFQEREGSRRVVPSLRQHRLIMILLSSVFFSFHSIVLPGCLVNNRNVVVQALSLSSGRRRFRLKFWKQFETQTQTPENNRNYGNTGFSTGPYVPDGLTLAEYQQIKQKEADQLAKKNFGAFGPRWKRQSSADGTDWMLMPNLWTTGTPARLSYKTNVSPDVQSKTRRRFAATYLVSLMLVTASLFLWCRERGQQPLWTVLVASTRTESSLKQVAQVFGKLCVQILFPSLGLTVILQRLRPKPTFFVLLLMSLAFLGRKVILA